ncbi:sigma-70 family RNA polymerase sigma factor [Nitrincola iocasae]|uniref:Sigma-70 family RNA polymerase sigma factor n=1 Tax=Nitrincola iocasae TaxID=2614693 RepID=A0A5J6LIC4_9GAMM|nr:sigma-70 family RNA polymerase sigma factor [Nitrincola iocasae]QEW08258.1 sigma-70 family RNA polymerase sigma factor [Nitrincola iocasae]
MNKLNFECVLRAWQLHEKELRAFLYHQLQHVDETDDCLQDVFVKSMQQGKGFCELANPKAWLFRVAKNSLIDRYRRSRPWTELNPEHPQPETDRDAIDELDLCLRRNIRELEPTDREIIEACDLQGMAQLDYAQQQGLTLTATKARLRRARQRLRRLLVTNCQVRFNEVGNVCCHVPRPFDAYRPSVNNSIDVTPNPWVDMND